jgi:tetratricopeptide (TPR) repeat protein
VQRNTILYIVFVGLAGFAAGFFLANSLNRSELANSRTVKNSNSSSSLATGEPDLSSSELRAKIEQADKIPQDFGYQKNLGVALYRYAAVKQDAELMSEALRILERARSLNSRDVEVLVALGNAHFDIGFFNKDNSRFETARALYKEALTLKLDNEVQTDLGISYFIQEPPDLDRAQAELKKVIKAEPKHERSRQFLVQVLLKEGKAEEAGKTLDELRAINPNNTALATLTQQVAANAGNP